MKRKSRVGTMLVLGGLLGALLGGCPMEPPPSDELAALPEPGVYYVQQQGDAKLYYLQMAQYRGEEHHWIALGAPQSWYEGPGFYRLSEDYRWSLERPDDGRVLDELLNLWDAPPAPPE